MGRAGYVAAGLLVTMSVGGAILDVRYGSGLAPVPFLVTVYALGVVSWFSLATLRLRLRPEVVVVAAMVLAVAMTATGAEFNYVFWFVGVPTSGALAASMPSVRGRLPSS